MKTTKKMMMEMLNIGKNIKWLKLQQNLILVEGCNPGPFTLNGTNTYILGTGLKRMMIDTGERLNIQYLKNLSECMNTENFQINKILITHYHHDHIGGLTTVVDHLRENKVDFSIYKRLLNLQIQKQYEQELKIKFQNLQENQTVQVEGAKLRAIYTQGHCKDHISLMWDDEGLLFTGDCIIGAPSVYFEDLKTYMDSLLKLRKVEGIKLLMPAHGQCVEEDPYGKIQTYYDYRKVREDAIIQYMNKKRGATLQQLIDFIYKGQYKPGDPRYLAANSNTTGHLKKMITEDKAYFDNQKGRYELKEYK